MIKGSAGTPNATKNCRNYRSNSMSNEDFLNALALKVGELSLPTTIEKKDGEFC
jgi:hypothetical protein